MLHRTGPKVSVRSELSLSSCVVRDVALSLTLRVSFRQTPVDLRSAWCKCTDLRKEQVEEELKSRLNSIICISLSLGDASKACQCLDQGSLQAFRESRRIFCIIAFGIFVAQIKSNLNNQKAVIAPAQNKLRSRLPRLNRKTKKTLIFISRIVVE